MPKHLITLSDEMSEWLAKRIEKKYHGIRGAKSIIVELALTEYRKMVEAVERRGS